MIRITYVGHATVQIETGGTCLLTDPVLRARVAHLRRIVAQPAPLTRTPDAVLISHAHLDHVDLPSLRQLPPCRVVAPRGLGRLLLRAGMGNVTALGAGETARIGSTTVTAVLAEHDGRRHPLQRARDALGYVIEGSGRVFFAGDTDLFDGMQDLAGTLDVALLPISGWGPRVGPGHLNPRTAARATAMLRPRVVIPIHWGTLASPTVRWRGGAWQPVREFEQQVAALGLDVEIRALAPGDSTTIAVETTVGSDAQ